MTTQQGLAIREEVGLTKAGLDHTRDQLILLENFVKDVLRKDEDYGVIPGTHGKPSLLKPGAANVTAAFNCHAEPVIDSALLDPNEGFVSYEAHVDLISNLTGLVMARGFGNCNSHEIKYRYHWEGKGEDRKRVENEEPLDQANTIKKMAIKRAEVDAAMRLPGVARFFTQDLEDIAQAPRPASWQGARPTTTPAPTPQAGATWCKEHAVAWFKRGNMRGFAHPIGKTDQWCNRPEPKVGATVVAPEDAPTDEPDPLEV